MVTEMFRWQGLSQRGPKIELSLSGVFQPSIYGKLTCVGVGVGAWGV